MRFFLTIVTILTLLSSGAFAIERVADTWDFGVKGGLTIADFYNCDDCIKDSKIGLTAGVFGEYKASPYFAIQPELLFVMKGWEVVGNNINLNYLEFPVLFKLKIPTQGNFSPNFFAGPAGALLVSAKSEGLDLSELFKSIDFGMAFGAGVDFVVGTGKIVFDVRYTLGLTAIPDNEELWGLPWEVPEIKNKAVSFSVGYGW